jgi:hypothetical protein
MPVLNAKFIPFQCEFCKRQIPSWAPFFQHNSTKKHIAAVGNITDMTKIYKPVVQLGAMMRKYFYERLEHRLKIGPLTRGSRQFYTIEVPDGDIEAECEVECDVLFPSPKFIEVKAKKAKLKVKSVEKSEVTMDEVEKATRRAFELISKKEEGNREAALEALEACYNAKELRLRKEKQEVLRVGRDNISKMKEHVKVKQFLKKSPIKMDASEEKKDPTAMTLTCNSCHCDFADFDTALVHRDTDGHIKACKASGSEEFLLKFPLEVSELIYPEEGVEIIPSSPPTLEREGECHDECGVVCRYFSSPGEPSLPELKSEPEEELEQLE